MGKRNKVHTIGVGDTAVFLVLDHSKNTPESPDTDPVWVEVYGKVKEIRPTYIVVYSWRVLHEDTEVVDTNSETFTIVRGAIESAWLLDCKDLRKAELLDE